MAKRISGQSPAIQTTYTSMPSAWLFLFELTVGAPCMFHVAFGVYLK